jgi:hypothetical protein
MGDAHGLSLDIDRPPAARWSVGGLLLEALATRDFDQLTDCFEPTATMRALLPSGSANLDGAAEIVDKFRCWFGDAEEFEVLDGTVGDVGDRLRVAWRLRLRPTPWGDDEWHVIEQQTYLRAADRIEVLDLLCSGFMPDGHR